jgi:uncharacterized protein (UPF0335 family)
MTTTQANDILDNQIEEMQRLTEAKEAATRDIDAVREELASTAKEVRHVL